MSKLGKKLMVSLLSLAMLFGFGSAFIFADENPAPAAEKGYVKVAFSWFKPDKTTATGVKRTTIKTIEVEGDLKNASGKNNYFVWADAEKVFEEHKNDPELAGFVLDAREGTGQMERYKTKDQSLGIFHITLMKPEPTGDYKIKYVLEDGTYVASTNFRAKKGSDLYKNLVDVKKKPGPEPYEYYELDFGGKHPDQVRETAWVEDDQQDEVIITIRPGRLNSDDKTRTIGDAKLTPQDFVRTKSILYPANAQFSYVTEPDWNLEGTQDVEIKVVFPENKTVALQDVEAKTRELTFTAKLTNLKKVEKQDLTDAIDSAKEHKETPDYEKASADKKTALDKALEEAEKVAGDKNATQDQVDKAAADLKKAMDDLDGNERNDLDKLIKNGETILADPNNAKKPDDVKKKLQDAIDKSKELLDKTPAATTEEIEKAEKELKDAMDEFMDAEDQKEADKKALNDAVDKANEAKETPAYKDATAEKKDAFDKALEEAEKVAADKNATQDQVDKAASDLKKATEELDGDKKAENTADAKKQLQDLIEKIENAIKENPNAKGTDTLKEMLEKAKKQLVDPNATLADLRGAYSKLDDAYKAWMNGAKETADATRKSEPAKAPKTGDEADFIALMTLLVLSSGGLLALKRKEN